MKKLFWGYVFLFLSFNLNLGINAVVHSLDILPDFVGYGFLLQGSRELEAESHYFKSIQPFQTVMAVYTAILWAGALLGIGQGGMLTRILADISGLVSLYVAWALVQGVLETERQRGAELNGQKLSTVWKALAVIRGTIIVLGWLADLANITVLLTLMIPLAVVGFAVSIWHLTAWWKAAQAWETLTGPDGLEAGE